MNLFFGLLFLVIANLAWATALGTTGPWFGPEISQQVYATSALVATFLAVLAAFAASARIAVLDRQLSALSRRIDRLRASQAVSESEATASSNPAVDIDEELDAYLEGLEDDGTALLVERPGHDDLVALPTSTRGKASQERLAALRALTKERIRLRSLRASVPRFAAGPILAALVDLAIAGAMLPGSGTFAATHFQLNTALVLYLGYTLAPLVAWTVLGLAFLHGGASDRED